MNKEIINKLVDSTAIESINSLHSFLFSGFLLSYAFISTSIASQKMMSKMTANREGPSSEALYHYSTK